MLLPDSVSIFTWTDIQSFSSAQPVRECSILVWELVHVVRSGNKHSDTIHVPWYFNSGIK